jgi:hypothetical protein
MTDEDEQKLASAIERLAHEVKYLGGGDHGDRRGAIEFAAVRIADAIESFASAVERHADALENLGSSIDGLKGADDNGIRFTIWLDGNDVPDVSGLSRMESPIVRPS